MFDHKQSPFFHRMHDTTILPKIEWIVFFYSIGEHLPKKR